MDSISSKFRLEEYIQVRKEIVSREKTITSLFTITLVTSVSILSAIATIFLKVDSGNNLDLKPEFALLFFSPLMIIIPMFYVIISHRYDMHRSGTYLEVFFEENRKVPLWETRLSKFRKCCKGESLDKFPNIFRAIFLISTFFFIYTIKENIKESLFSSDFFSQVWFSGFVVILVSMIFISKAIKKYNKSLEIREEYYKKWVEIKKNEGMNRTKVTNKKLKTIK